MDRHCPARSRRSQLGNNNAYCQDSPLWDNPLARALGVFYNGAAVGKDHRGRMIRDHNFLLYCNSGDDPVVFTLPSAEYPPSWEQLIDTAGEHADTGLLHANETVELVGKSLLVLRAYTTPPEKPDHSVSASLALLTTPEQRESPKTGVPGRG